MPKPQPNVISNSPHQKYFLRAYCNDGEYYDCGCYSGYSLYSYRDMINWNKYGNANKFRIFKQNRFAKGYQDEVRYEIRLSSDAGDYSVYNSTEHCNGWYVKVCNQSEGQDHGDGVNNFQLIDSGKTGRKGEKLWYVKSGKYYWWCSDHAGAGSAWYIKAVSSIDSATGFAIVKA